MFKTVSNVTIEIDHDRVVGLPETYVNTLLAPMGETFGFITREQARQDEHEYEINLNTHKSRNNEPWYCVRVYPEGLTETKRLWIVITDFQLLEVTQIPPCTQAGLFYQSPITTYRAFPLVISIQKNQYWLNQVGHRDTEGFTDISDEMVSRLLVLTDYNADRGITYVTELANANDPYVILELALPATERSVEFVKPRVRCIRVV